MISFHPDFQFPTRQDRIQALGPFPLKHKANSSRKEKLERIAATSTTATTSATTKKSNDVSLDDDDNHHVPTLSLSDLDQPKLYTFTPRSETSFAIPQPLDELDWLVQVPEEGQTFQEYMTFTTTRKGRIKPITNMDGVDILILPIVRASNNNNDDDDDCPWPLHGPPLHLLCEYTKAFFDRNVRILPHAKLHVKDNDTINLDLMNSGTTSSSSSSSSSSREKKRKRTQPLGTFASSTSKEKFKLSFPDINNSNTTVSYSLPINIAGRQDIQSGRIQLQVISILEELSSLRRETKGQNEFCIMAVTMEDLYDGPKDLFCAGMAYGGEKVAVFSYARYCVNIKMHPEQWHNYGYQKINGSRAIDYYSYYDNNNQNPGGLENEPLDMSFGNGGDEELLSLKEKNMKKQATSEFLRRCTKLLTHELGHLYCLDHCIYNRCLMMGTGHLVEDFRAPSHLCGICLRKLQWRLGFDIKDRYKSLSLAFDAMGMGKEKRWCDKQIEYLVSSSP